MGKVKVAKLGSLYVDGSPVAVGSTFTGQQLDIGDTAQGMPIEWIVANKLLIANQSLCTHISWDQLDRMSFVHGRFITPNGRPYACRLMYVGKMKNSGIEPNEWDDALNAIGEDNLLWHWENISFWGQNERDFGYKMLRAGTSARAFDCCNSEFRHETIGFRPVLEPLFWGHQGRGPQKGSVLKLYGPNGWVLGILTDKTKYDFFLTLLDNSPNLKMTGPWVSRDSEKSIIVDRNAVGYQVVLSKQSETAAAAN